MHGANDDHEVRWLRARETRHRRTVLLLIAVLIVMSTSPVFGHHLATRADSLLAGRDHVLGLCLIALHEILAPVHLVVHVIVAAGLGYAVVDRVRAWLQARRVFADITGHAVPPTGPLLAAVRRVGLAPDRIGVIRGSPNPAFTIGWWRPRVYVDASLPDVLDPDETTSVLAHEAWHVRRRDPLRLSALRFLACTLFYLPALRRLADAAAEEAEIAADDAAAGTEPLVLASAILRIAEGWNDRRRDLRLAQGDLVGFVRDELLERRIRRLAGEGVAPTVPVTRRSLAGAALWLVVVWASGVVMAHPMPATDAPDRGAHAMHVIAFTDLGQSATATPAVAERAPGRYALHCAHYRRFAVTHLFCLGALRLRAGALCPHARPAAIARR